MKKTILILAAVVGCNTPPPKMDRPDPRPELSVQEMKAIYATEPDSQRKFDALVDIVHRYSWQSLNSYEARDAQARAIELLKMAQDFQTSANYGNAIHHANLTLGRVRLLAGDVQSASRYLLKAAHVTGSPQLNAYGPNMTLAKELLLKGQSKAVQVYLGKVKVFWLSRYSSDPLRQWHDEIALGKVPDFGVNLTY